MKKLIVAALLYMGIALFPTQARSQVSVSFQVFYDDLSPYGLWVNNPTYGYIWVPTVSAGFSPYATEGYWVYTDLGWTWVSYYSWGWGPFHYGRWYYDPFYGYAWVPGYEWGPAWVGWRHCDGYYGWSPLGPGISYGPAYVNYNPPPERWVFVRESDFGKSNINNYYADRSLNASLVKRSSVIQNTVVDRNRNQTYIAGPPRTEVQKVTGRRINPLPVAEAAKPVTKVSDGKLQIYRPQVERPSAGQKLAPSKVYSENEAKPIIEKKRLGAGNGAPGVTPSENQRLNPNQKGNPAPAANPRNDRQQKLTSPDRTISPADKGKRLPVNEEPRIKSGQQNEVKPNVPQREGARPREINPPAQRREQAPAEQLSPNEPRMRGNEGRPNQPENVRPVQPREVEPAQRREQPAERLMPNEPRMRGNDIRPSQPENVRPVQPREVSPPPMREPQQAPMQRMNPNPPQQAPMQRTPNPPSQPRMMPMGGPHRPH